MNSNFWKDDISQSGRLHTHTLFFHPGASRLFFFLLYFFWKGSPNTNTTKSTWYVSVWSLTRSQTVKGRFMLTIPFFFAFWKRPPPGWETAKFGLVLSSAANCVAEEDFSFGLECVKHEIGVLAPAVCPLIDVRILRVHGHLSTIWSDRP